MLPQAHQLSLKLLEKCPSCHAAVPTRNVNIIDETDTGLFAHLSCTHCLNNYLTYIINHPNGIVGNAILTDCTFDEVMHYRSADSLTEDLVLRIHRLIHSSDFTAEIKHSLTQS